MTCELFLVVCSRSSSHYASVLRPFLCIFVWYSLSMMVAVLNDWYMEVDGFDFPIYLSINHMIVIFLGSYIFKHTNWYTRIYFGRKLDEDEDNDLRVAYRGFQSWKECFVKVGSMTVLMAVAVSLNNLALDYIDITAVQVISSMAVLIVLIASTVSKQEKLDIFVVVSVIIIVAGAIYSSYDQVRGQPLGFIFAALATLANAMNVVLVYGMLRGESVVHTPLDLMVYFSLPVVLLLIIPFFVFELPIALRIGESFPFFYTLLIVATESILFFFMTWSAFTLIDMTSAITFEVLGSLRQVFVFLAALVFFRERLTPSNIIGNVIILFGMTVYAAARMKLFDHCIKACKIRRHSTEIIYLDPVEPIHEDWSGI